MGSKHGRKRDHANFVSDSDGPVHALEVLDQNYPRKIQHTSIPSYKVPQNGDPDRVTRSPSSSSLPPLPPVAPGNLSTAPFTHPSAASSRYVSSSTSPKTSIDSHLPQLNYERLEFLGDAYIEIIATRIIYARFPHLLTGKQARVREALVRNSTLADFADRYGFGRRVIGDKAMMGEGQGYNGHGHNKGSKGPKHKTWEKMLADVFEAYVAAVVLSNIDNNGFGAAETWLEHLWAPLLSNPEAILSASAMAGTASTSAIDNASRGGKNENGHTTEAKKQSEAQADVHNKNWKDTLQAAIWTPDIFISYIDEELKLPPDLHLRSKDEQFHTKQLRKVGVFVTLTDKAKADSKEVGLDANSPLFKGPVRLGGAIAKGKKEAGMLGAKEALKDGGEMMAMLKARKIKMAEERARVKT